MIFYSPHDDWGHFVGSYSMLTACLRCKYGTTTCTSDTRLLLVTVNTDQSPSIAGSTWNTDYISGHVGAPAGRTRALNASQTSRHICCYWH